MVEIKGKEKRAIRAVLKTRLVDLKIGKRGLTPEFLRECFKILARDSMIKLELPKDKDLQIKLMEEFREETSSQCIAKVGKTVAFYKSNE